MYFVEWLTWLSYIDPKEERDAFDKQNKQPKLKDIYESDDLEMLESAKRPATSNPASRGPIYSYNNDILEMRYGMREDKRGLISILSLTIISMIISDIYVFTSSIKIFARLSQNYNGEPYGERLFLALFFLSMGVGTLWLYLKFGLRFTRFEMFTSRHLLIRFNRTTQQVYLHRPSYCGGIVTLPWHGVMCSGSDKKYAAAGSLGVPLVLIWPPSFTGTLHPELVHVGKATNNFAELQAEWEFIRRFMDEGPEGLPRPHITSHFPWPWQAFTPQFEGLTHYFRTSSRITKIGLLLISPAFLIIGTGHWLSLMLCWKPRWPKIIREAGLPGKPVPPFTTLDDYPPAIQERLRENAYLWAARPGKRPERKKRTSTRKPKTEVETSALEKDILCATDRSC
ncbi:hypothetical protein DZC75_07825 [Pseudomonas parafulva]|uniref:DUF6708 domain-containing protein n=1 Tax=Pseudomonas parafulva TaxID=157782 RepID=A0AAI8PAZ3_9PSED|nr:DUF6708 domain-containing protein [Pseudomonas parafulva]AXO87915.1 hypothetical protein DZC75_07825 [Pseudomonas parafulva]